MVEDKLLALLDPVLKPLKAIREIFKRLVDHFTTIPQKIFDITTEAIAEYQAIRDFESKPHWKSRVISVPRAVETLQRFAKIPGELVAAIRDLASKVKESLMGIDKDAPLAEGDIEGLAELKAAGKKLGTKLAAALERVLGVVTIIIGSLDVISGALDDVKKILDDVKEVRQDLENLDGLFLPQNKRQVKMLKEGRFRV